jgi:hypothetical protein
MDFAILVNTNTTTTTVLVIVITFLVIKEHSNLYLFSLLVVTITSSSFTTIIPVHTLSSYLTIASSFHQMITCSYGTYHSILPTNSTISLFYSMPKH